MIKEEIIYQCPKCGSANIVKNGQYKNKQKYKCNDCESYGTLNPTVKYNEERKAEILRAYQERQSMRGIRRTYGISIQTLVNWLKKKLQMTPEIEETLVPSELDDVLELDEIWTYVWKKDNEKYIWLALCRRTRQIVAYYIGDRSEESCYQFWLRIPREYWYCKTFSDIWEAYDNVFCAGDHQMVGKESGETAHIERFNNTLRQRLSRFVRKTLSFSKSDFFLELTLKLFIVRYNTELSVTS